MATVRAQAYLTTVLVVPTAAGPVCTLTLTSILSPSSGVVVVVLLVISSFSSHYHRLRDSDTLSFFSFIGLQLGIVIDCYTPIHTYIHQEENAPIQAEWSPKGLGFLVRRSRSSRPVPKSPSHGWFDGGDRGFGGSRRFPRTPAATKTKTNATRRKGPEGNPTVPDQHGPPHPAAPLCPIGPRDSAVSFEAFLQLAGQCHPRPPGGRRGPSGRTL